MATSYDQSEYELREARSEIRRHHTLIKDMREALDWSLSMVQELGGNLAPADRVLLTKYFSLLNRQVG